MTMPVGNASTAGVQGRITSRWRINDLRAVLPLHFQRIDIQIDIMQRRVSGGEVLNFDHGAAMWAVVLQYAAPVGVRRVGSRVKIRVEQRRMNLARIAIIDQQPLLVILARVADLMVATPAF